MFQLVSFIETVIKNIYPDKHIQMVTSMRAIEIIDNDNISTISNISHHKVHLVFNGLDVSIDRCAELFQEVIEKVYVTFDWLCDIERDLISKLETPIKAGSWKPKIFDSSVYSSGLRMLGSIKPPDKDKSPSNIPKEYREVEYSGDGVWFGTPLSVETIERSSIISPNSTLAESKIKVSYKVNYDSVRNIIGVYDLLLTGSTSSSNKRHKGKESTQVINRSSDVREVKITDALKQFLKTQFNIVESKLTDMKFYKDSNSYVIGTVETHCPFQKRDHHGNHVYFTITMEFITRKCHSTKCSDLSENIPLPKEFQDSLYHDKDTIKKDILQYFEDIMRLKQGEALDIQKVSEEHIENVEDDDEEDLYIIDIKPTYCFFIKKDSEDHKQSIVITKDGKAYQKCHANNEKCKDKKSTLISIEQKILNSIPILFDNGLDAIDPELIEKCKKEVQDLINHHFKSDINTDLVRMPVTNNRTDEMTFSAPLTNIDQCQLYGHNQTGCNHQELVACINN
jgi:hypothetical protein